MNPEELLRLAAEAFDAGDAAAGTDFVAAASKAAQLLTTTPSGGISRDDLTGGSVPVDSIAVDPIATVGTAQAEQERSIQTLNDALAASQPNAAGATGGGFGAPDASGNISIPGVGNIQLVPLLGGGVLTKSGGPDRLKAITGESGNTVISSLLENFNNLRTGISGQITEQQDILRRTRGGEFDERFSNPAFQNMRIASTPAEAQAIRESGGIPIAARDAEAIRRIGQQEADQIRADAQQALAVRQGEERAGRLSQIGAGLGSGIASALTRTNVNPQQRTRITQLADQARQGVLTGVENRRQANAAAGRLDSKSKLDSMLANTEAVKELQNLMIADASQAFQLRHAEEERVQQRIQELSDQDRRLQEQRPALLANLVQIHAANNPPAESQFVDLSRRSASAGTSKQERTQTAILTASQVAQEASAIAERAKNSAGLFTNLDEQAADAEIIKLIGSVTEFMALTDPTSKLNVGLITPEVIALREDVMRQVSPFINQLESSGIILRDEDGQITGVDVELNDIGGPFGGPTKDFALIGAESFEGLSKLVDDLGGPNAPPAILRPGSNNRTLSRSSTKETSDSLVTTLLE